MEEKNKRDIVDQIVEKMQSIKELPYKEGSWENFQQYYGSKTPKKNKVYYWAASAAAILLLGFFLLNNWTTQQKSSSVPNFVNHDSENQSNNLVEPAPFHEKLPNDNSFNDVVPKIALNSYNNNLNRGEERINQSLSQAYTLSKNLSYSNSVQFPLALNKLELNKNRIHVSIDDENSLILNNSMNDNLAYNTQGNINGQEQELKNRNFNFNEKFDLGLFVSPSSTDDRFSFGGGFLLAYNLNKHISIRTGLAYNKYDVSVMKDPVANAETPVNASREMLQKSNLLSQDKQFMSTSVILPNINAISGNVQALEIPLDIRVKSKNGFYASSGLTYATVFNQNRYAHYVDNANSELFGNGLPENEADVKSAVQPVSKAIKTEDENISQNGFGGFVNFSIGKEMKMKKNINLSIEPYLKLPVGSFKRADMNYTNGGIRIITNF